MEGIWNNLLVIIYSIAFLFRIAFDDLLDFSVFERYLVIAD